MPQYEKHMGKIKLITAEFQLNALLWVLVLRMLAHSPTVMGVQTEDSHR